MRTACPASILQTVYVVAASLPLDLPLRFPTVDEDDMDSEGRLPVIMLVAAVLLLLLLLLASLRDSVPLPLLLIPSPSIALSKKQRPRLSHGA